MDHHWPDSAYHGRDHILSNGQKEIQQGNNRDRSRGERIPAKGT